MNFGKVAILTITVVLTAGAVLYGTMQGGGNLGTVAACEAGANRVADIEPTASGQLAAFVVADQVVPLPELTFTDRDDVTRTTGDWQGKVTLVNLWATWCVPCREEMPDLNNLKAMFKDQAFDVVAISLDRGNKGKPIAFLEEIGADELDFYHDPDSESFNALKQVGLAFGLPATVLLDENGCRLGHLAGPAVWDGEDAQALIRAALPS